MIVRRILVLLLALGAAGTVIRTAFVEAYVESDPGVAVRVWAGHPDVTLSAGFARIGEAARRGRSPPSDALADVADAARKAPLAVEPFLVRGVSAQVANDRATAERALHEAKRRDPRSRAARYLLAELYFRSGRILGGLREVSALSRLMPESGNNVAPFLAEYARTPGAATKLAGLFREQPSLQPAILGELAKDAANADLVLALADGAPRTGDQSWKERLLGSLVADGQYRKAREAWIEFSGASAAARLFDPGFRGSAAPPPFNWSFGKGTGGLAEPEKGSLHIIYYGRDQAILASQLLTLDPGRYRLWMRVGGGPRDAKTLAWRVTCLPGNAVIAELPLVGTRPTTDFAVAADCAAQRLELIGVPRDVPAQVDLNVSDLNLLRLGA